MKPHEIRVSVIVPTYNVERYLRATLDSLLRQTLRDFEAIVVDDGSTDGTVAIVEEYRDERIRLVRHAANRGVAEARNTGLRHARGEYIALMDADDIALPTRLAEQVAALDADPALGMIGACVAVINEAGMPTGTVWSRPLAPADVAIGMLFRNTIFASVVFRKSAVPDGAFRAFPVAGDYDFNVRLARHAKVANLAKPLTQYRIRGSSLTQTKQDLHEKYVHQIMRNQIRELGFEPTPHELDLNRHVGALTLPNSPELLVEIGAWLIKLRDANRRTGRYPEADFLRNLGAEWFTVCKFASPLGGHAFRVWRASPLSKTWQPNAREKLKFAVKCLLRHSRPGGDVPSLA
jgi:glycosyltransferase involved in cell wall biosynthesis